MSAFLICQHSNEKIKIPEGETAVGRGPFLKVIDKRVSRTHAIIKLHENILTIKPVHKNPTFCCGDGKAEYTSLPKDAYHELLDGDKISLLPNDLIFSVEIPSDNDMQQYDINASENKDTTFGINDEMSSITFPSSDTQSKETDRKPSPGLMEGKSEKNPAKSDTQRKETDLKSSSGHMEERSEESPARTSLKSLGKKRILPGWMVDSTITDASKKKLPAKKKAKVTADSKTAASESAKVTADSKTVVAESAKVTANSKTVVAESAKVTANSKTAAAVSDSSNEAPQFSNAVASTNLVQNEKKETEEKKLEDNLTSDEKVVSSKNTTSVEVSAGPVKPVCPYGSNCYRKNPAHFKENSHDDVTNTNVNELEEDEKPECEYGTSCYRTNPQHLKEYKHTQTPEHLMETRKRTSRRKKKGGAGKSVHDDASDDDGEPNTYDCDDSFIDDGDTASSESYEDENDSDFNPDEQGSEDLTELLAEADDFMTN